MIEQWGRIEKGSNLSAGSSWRTSAVLPIAFSTSTYVLTFGFTTSSTSSGEEICGQIIDNKSFNVLFYNRNSSTTITLPVINWIAKGY